MTLTVELPNDIAQHENAAREALEAVVLEGVRTDAISRPDGRKLLDMERLEFMDFLHANGVPATTYGVEDLLQDIETGDRLRAQGLLP